MKEFLRLSKKRLFENVLGGKKGKGFLFEKDQDVVFTASSKGKRKQMKKHSSKGKDQDAVSPHLPREKGNR